ncbi:MAG: hypothetical protein ABIW31_06265, partial [Novosphingobium sp.]
MRKFVAYILLVAPFYFGTAVCADAPNEVTVTIGADQFVMPVPVGFCVPVTAEDKAVEQMTAAIDTHNVTVATFMACGREGVAPMKDYVLVKVPTQALMAKLEKVDTLNQIERAVAAPKFANMGPTIKQEVEKSAGKVIGGKTEFTGDFGYRGRDADCIYFGGRMNVSVATAGLADSGFNGSCGSVVGGKYLVVHVYDFTPTGKVSELMEQARQIMLSMHPLAKAH